MIPGDGAGEFLPGTFMTVTLSCDHRVIDGELSTLLLLVIAAQSSHYLGVESNFQRKALCCITYS